MCTQTAHTANFSICPFWRFFWIFKSKPKCAWCVHILMSHFSMLNTYPISILWYIVYSLTHTEYGDMTSQNHMTKISKMTLFCHFFVTFLSTFCHFFSDQNLTKITQKFDFFYTFLFWIILLSRLIHSWALTFLIRRKSICTHQAHMGFFEKNRGNEGSYVSKSRPYVPDVCTYLSAC